MKLALILITQSLGTFVFNNCLFPQTIIWTSFVTQVGVGVLYKVLYGTLHLRVHLLCTFVPFWKKRRLFCRSFFAKGSMFPFAILFNNTASLYYSLGNKLDNVAESPHSGWREWMRAFQQHFRTRRMESLNRRFPCPFILLNLWNPYPFIILHEAWKKIPLLSWASPNRSLQVVLLLTQVRNPWRVVMKLVLRQAWANV